MNIDDDGLRIEAPMLVLDPEQIWTSGQVLVRRGQISEVTAHTNATPDVVLHDCGLVPGLINCHTHLEFSHLPKPIPCGATFPEWIGGVVRQRRQEAAGLSPSELSNQRGHNVRQGLLEASATGTALIGDIVTPPWSPPQLARAATIRSAAAARFCDRVELKSKAAADKAITHLGGLAQILAFPEMIGLEADRLDESLNWATEQRLLPSTELLLGVGSSPHAPYSLLLEPVAARLSQLPSSMPLAMHLAESLDELQWLEHASGAFAEAFANLGIPPPATRPSIDACLHMLSTHRRSLVVHGNYLTEAQMQFIASSDAGTAKDMSVIYCPRTHKYFEHATYPLRRMLQNNVLVTLGTDSRASNPDLDLWQEIRTARQQHPWLSPQQAFAMATTQAAWALGVSHQFGTLRVGCSAHLFALRLASGDTPRTLLERITSPAADVDLINLRHLLMPNDLAAPS